MTVDAGEALAEQFERRRPQLRAVAIRLLGSADDADDALQDAWLRAQCADRSEIVNLEGWLTTIVVRVCLSVLRSRRIRGEQPLDLQDERTWSPSDSGPERDAELADALEQAMSVVLTTLTPAERVAFVMHDAFAVPFDEIAAVLDRTPVAVRQLASRARRRLADGHVGSPDRARTRPVVNSFLAAARGGDLDGLLAVLSPDVLLRADTVAVRMASEAAANGAPALSALQQGASTVARTFAGRAGAARSADIDGLPGLVWAPGGVIRVAFDLLIRDGRIVLIETLADPDSLNRMRIALD